MTNINVSPIDPQQMINQLDILYATKQPGLLLGSPGVGKSAIIKEWAESKGYHLVTRMLSQTQPGDLCIPSVDHEKGVLHWNTADWLVELPKDRPTIFFFDELPSAPVEVRCSIYQLLLDKKLGGHTLPDNAYIICAGNRASDNASAFEIDTAMADRLNIFVIEANPDQWLKWAIKSGIHHSVLTFIKTRPDMLIDEDNFAELIRVSPRSWAKVSDVIHLVNNPEQVTTLIQGIIGLDATATFIQTLREVNELPDLDLLTKMNPSEFHKYTPTSVASLWGLAYALEGWSVSSKKLAEALRVVAQLFPMCTAVECREDVMGTAFSLLMQKMYDKRWVQKVHETESYMKIVRPIVRQIPSLSDAIEFLEG